MSSIIADEGKIVCLITGIQRKETPEEYVRQEFCRVLLDVYGYPRTNIELEYSINIGISKKRVDIVVFNTEERAQDNIYLIVETKKKNETEGVNQLYSYMSATSATFGVWTNGDSIQYRSRDAQKIGKFNELPDIPKYKESIDAIGKYIKDDLVKCTDLKRVFGRCNNYFYVNQGLTQDKRFSEMLKGQVPIYV